MGFCLLIHPHANHDAQGVCCRIWCLRDCICCIQHHSLYHRIWIRRRNNYLCPSCFCRTWKSSSSTTGAKVTRNTSCDPDHYSDCHALYVANIGKAHHCSSSFWFSSHSRRSAKSQFAWSYHTYCFLDTWKRHNQSIHSHLCISDAYANRVYLRQC